MRLSSSKMVIVGSVASVLASPVSAQTLDSNGAESSVTGSLEELDRLRLRLAEAEAVGEVSTEELATLSALLDAASRVLDPRDSPEARASAVSDMVSSRDERMLRLVWVASQVRSVAVRRSVVAQVW